MPCRYVEGIVHEFPDDWVFGGADGKHPGADPRFAVNNYTYFDEDVQPLFHTCAPVCDEAAVDDFTWVASLGPDFRPKWVAVRRKDGHEEMLPWVYDKDTDTVTEKVRA